MNQRVVKQIRANMYYPKARKYQTQPNGQIISNPERRLYQSLKKKYLVLKKEKSAR